MRNVICQEPMLPSITSGNRKMKRCPGLSLEFQGRGDLSTIMLIGHLLPSNFVYLKMGFDVTLGISSTVLIRSRLSLDLTLPEFRFFPSLAQYCCNYSDHSSTGGLDPIVQVFWKTTLVYCALLVEKYLANSTRPSSTDLTLNVLCVSFSNLHIQDDISGCAALLDFMPSLTFHGNVFLAISEIR